MQAPKTVTVMPSMAMAEEARPVSSAMTVLNARPFSLPWMMISPASHLTNVSAERRYSALAGGVLSVFFFRSTWMNEGMFHSQGGPESQSPAE